MLFKNLKVSRFLILIWLLIPFIFANDSYARNGEPRMESFEGTQSPTRTQRDNSGIIVQNQNISMKSLNIPLMMSEDKFLLHISSFFRDKRDVLCHEWLPW